MSVLFPLGEGREIVVEAFDSLLQCFRVDFGEDGPFVFPLGETFLVLVRRADVVLVGVKGVVLVAGVVVCLAVDVDVVFDFRSHACLVRIGAEAVVVPHRYTVIVGVLLFNDWVVFTSCRLHPRGQAPWHSPRQPVNVLI